MTVLVQLVLLVVGFTLLIKGADVFVEGASGVADRLGIPPLVVGLTIVAMGTSAPEAAISITSALRGSAGISVGNVVGSNIMNILLILGLTALIKELPVQRSTLKYELPFVIATSFVFAILGYQGSSLSRIEGGILWVFFIIYLAYLFITTKRSKDADSERLSQEYADIEDKGQSGMSLLRLVLYIVLGAAVIVWGSDLTVDSASALASFAGISDRIIGLTVVAFGTSLPELCTSISAARKGDTDIAIGNIVGSNIFNLLFVAGTAAAISPLAFQTSFIIDSIIAAAAAIMLLVLSVRKHALTKIGGLVMLVAYAAYFIYIL